jgi:hypothetical protein
MAHKPVKKRWRSKSSRGRAQAGLGYLDSKRERLARNAAHSAADAFLAHRDPWDEVTAAKAEIEREPTDR